MLNGSEILGVDQLKKKNLGRDRIEELIITLKRRHYTLNGSLMGQR